VAGKATKIFFGNMKLLLFEDMNINDQYLEITILVKNCGHLCKKLD
jgi:hypothetical protein